MTRLLFTVLAVLSDPVLSACWVPDPWYVAYPEVAVPPKELVLEPEAPIRDVPKAKTLRLRVTACSPDDPQDREYYRRHGYAGAVYGIAADLRVFPKGTKMRIPGYLDKMYPGEWWTVDSPGGSVIRRSTSRGVYHVDVKFKTYGTAKKWGSQWLDVEVMYPQ
jgi:3D (Asp-Asp-Asp) domain-containing protein